MYDSKNAHGSTASQGENSDTNGILYTRCTDVYSFRSLDTIQLIQAVYILYTHCTNLYSLQNFDTVQVPQAVYASWEVPWCLVQLVYDSKNAQGSILPQGKHSEANGIFVHPLYGSVQLHEFQHRIGATSCVRKLGGPVLPCTDGVRFQKCTWQHTTSRALLK